MLANVWESRSYGAFLMFNFFFLSSKLTYPVIAAYYVHKETWEQLLGRPRYGVDLPPMTPQFASKYQNTCMCSIESHKLPLSSFAALLDADRAKYGHCDAGDISGLSLNDIDLTVS